MKDNRESDGAGVRMVSARHRINLSLDAATYAWVCGIASAMGVTVSRAGAEVVRAVKALAQDGAASGVPDDLGGPADEIARMFSGYSLAEPEPWRAAVSVSPYCWAEE